MNKVNSKKVPMTKAGSQHKRSHAPDSSCLVPSGAKPGTQVARGGKTGQMTDCKMGPTKEGR